MPAHTKTLDIGYIATVLSELIFYYLGRSAGRDQCGREARRRPPTRADYRLMAIWRLCWMIGIFFMVLTIVVCVIFS